MSHVYLEYFSRWEVFLLRDELPSEDCVVYRADGDIRVTDQNIRLKNFLKEIGIQSTNSTHKKDIEDFLQKVRLSFPLTSIPSPIQSSDSRKLEHEDANPQVNTSTPPPPPPPPSTSPIFLPPVQPNQGNGDAADKLPSINYVMANVDRYYSPSLIAKRH
jgi:hypothetical protein